jgi:hypothetical protein
MSKSVDSDTDHVAIAHLAAMAAILLRRNTDPVLSSILDSRSCRSTNGNWHPKWVMNTSRRCRMMGVVGIPSGAITSSTGMVGPEPMPVPGAPRAPRLVSGKVGRQVACGLSTRTLRVMRLRPGGSGVSGSETRAIGADARGLAKIMGGRERELTNVSGEEREKRSRAQKGDRIRKGTE